MISVTVVRVVVDMKKILVVSCSAVDKSRGPNLMIKKSLDLLRHEVDLKIHYENTTGLPEIYNQYINVKTLKKHDIVLFVHDDVYIDDLKLRGKLYNAIKDYDIIGLAGCLSPVIKTPALWHLMADRKNLRGFVAHVNKEDISTIHMTSFGITPSRVALVDGLFMAVNLKKALAADWKFDEDFKFHHYDISSCLSANQKKLKIGVIPVSVIHASPGLQSISDPDFTESQKIFLKKYHN